MSDILLSICLTVPLLCSIYFYIGTVLPFQEHRTDLTRIHDPCHKYFPRLDTSWPITVIEHSCHLLYLYELFFVRTHIDVPHAMLSFILFLWTRSFMLYLLPLKVSHEMILLRDPIQYFFLYGRQTQRHLFVQDLFFSGHVSFCVLMALTCPNHAYVFYIATLLIFICMMCSRIHYTIDMVAAPFIIYSLCQLSSYLINHFIRQRRQEILDFYT